MKNSVKLPGLFTIFFFFFISASAQLKISTGNGIGSDVKKVIEDYPNRFINLMGAIINQSPQSTDYLCNFKINGAEESFVTRYAAKKEVCSWEAVMLTTENFEKAKQKFRSLFNQLQNLTVKFGQLNYKLKGQFESPAEAMKFTGVMFSLDPNNAAATKLKIELNMQYVEPMEWKVRISIYDKEKEDNERGEIRE